MRYEVEFENQVHSKLGSHSFEIYELHHHRTTRGVRPLVLRIDVSRTRRCNALESQRRVSLESFYSSQTFKYLDFVYSALGL
jgi:hypothetical protein